MLEVKKELLDSFDGYDITIQDKNNALFINRTNKSSLSFEVKSSNKPMIISIEEYEIYTLFEDLFEKVFNCNVNDFKDFSYNEYIKFINLYKNICNNTTNSIIINDNDNQLIIEKHKYFFKIICLNNNKINLSKDNLSFIYNYFLELLNKLEKIDYNNHQITINEYLIDTFIKQKVRKR